MFLSDYIADVQEIVHDSTSSSWPLSRVISRINDARRDVARDMHAVRQNVTGVQLIQGQEIYNLSGAVAGATVTAGGSNFGPGSTVPVTFSAAPAGGITALGVGNLINGSLVSISLTQWGQGYTGIPTITVGGVGSGAAATAVCLFQSNPLSTVVGQPLVVGKVSYIWNQQRRQLSYLPFRTFDAFYRVWATTTFQQPPSAFTVVQQGVIPQVYIQAPPDQLYLSEWDITYQTAPLVATTDFDNQIIEPWNQAVQFAAAAYLLYKHQNLGQVAGLHDKYTSYVPHILSTSGGVRVMNPYHTTQQRRAIRALSG
jgi:hypothetical protein